MTLFVRIKPNQRLDQIERVNNEWQIRLKAPAVDGKANDHLLTFLSQVLNLPKAAILIKRGHSSRMKYLEINATTDYVLGKLEALVNE